MIGQTLRWLTKEFKTPMNLQYLGIVEGKHIFSDGIYSIAADVALYGSMFTSIPPNTIITILMCTRQREAPFNLKFCNLRVAPRHAQVHCRLGTPTPYV